MGGGGKAYNEQGATELPPLPPGPSPTCTKHTRSLCHSLRVRPGVGFPVPANPIPPFHTPFQGLGLQEPSNLLGFLGALTSALRAAKEGQVAGGGQEIEQPPSFYGTKSTVTCFLG